MQSTADSTAIVWYGHGLAAWLQQRLAAHLIDLLLFGGCLVRAIFGLEMAVRPSQIRPGEAPFYFCFFVSSRPVDHV